MKQNIFFAVILLTTLSIVNAFPHHQLHKRATVFAPCPTGSPTPLTVTIQPDPPVAGGTLMFTISGTPASEITPGSMFVIQAFDNTGAALGEPATVDFCTIQGVPSCPLPAQTAFSVILQFPLANTLPATYSIAVNLSDGTGATLACSLGTITGA
jgi:hypothetical protein